MTLIKKQSLLQIYAKKHDECPRSVLICKSIHFNFCISLCIKRKHDWLHPQKPHSSNTGTIMTKRHVFYCSFYVFFPFFMSFYFVCSVFFYFLCTVFPHVHNCLFCIFVQLYGKLPPGVNPNAVKKHHIMYKMVRHYCIHCQTSDVPSADSSVCERKKIIQFNLSYSQH